MQSMLGGDDPVVLHESAVKVNHRGATSENKYRNIKKKSQTYSAEALTLKSNRVIQSVFAHSAAICTPTLPPARRLRCCRCPTLRMPSFQSEPPAAHGESHSDTGGAVSEAPRVHADPRR